MRRIPVCKYPHYRAILQLKPFVPPGSPGHQNDASGTQTIVVGLIDPVNNGHFAWEVEYLDMIAARAIAGERRHRGNKYVPPRR